MRLTDLDPRWVASFDAPDDAKQGVSFICPHCQDADRRLAVFFENPITAHVPADLKANIAAGHLPDHHVGAIHWKREGETFDDLTLTPSIDASHFGHWHGYIRCGAIC